MRKFILALVLVLFTSNINPVYAASAGISGPNTINIGETKTYTVSVSGEMLEGNVTASSNVSLSSTNDFTPPRIVSFTNSAQIKVTGTKVGSATISFNGFSTTSTKEKVSSSITVNVVDPKSNTGNGGGQANKPTNPNTGNSNSKPSKTPEQIAAEKKAAEEAAKKAKEEAERLEKEKIEKTPLFKEIEVISLDQVLHGQNIGTIKAEFDKNSYEFTLPKYVNKYKLQVNTDESGVEFVFDEEHDFTDSKDVSKTIDLRAVKGDLSQNFTIKLNKNTEVDAVRKHEDKEYNVFSSDKLEEFMKARGYVKKEHDVGGVKSYYFEKDKLKVQLLFDDKLNGKWFILDDKLEFGNEVILIDLKNDLFFVDEAPEELAKKSIEENKYSEKTIDYASLYSDIHQGLVMNNKYKSWELEDTGEIVYGIKSDGVEGTYLLAGKLPSDAKVEKAFISFGSNDSKYQKISWALGGTLFALIGTGGFLQLSKKKKED